MIVESINDLGTCIRTLTSSSSRNMSAAEIQALAQPPSDEHAQSMTLQWLNEKFPTFDQFQESDDLELLVRQAASEAGQLKAQVNPLPFLPKLGHLSRLS